MFFICTGRLVLKNTLFFSAWASAEYGFDQQTLILMVCLSAVGYSV